MKQGMKQIYLDHLATTPLRPEVFRAMEPYFLEHFGNPLSLHPVGQAARTAVEEAREKTAALIHARPEEIIFTGSGTESCNFAVKGIARAYAKKGRHIVTSAVEHHAVANPLRYLEKEGFEVTTVPVDAQGRVDPDEVAAALRDDTILVSIMLANNEIGTLEPVEAVGAVTRDRGIPLHTDATAAVGNMPVDVEALQVDALSLSAHKFYGPKGVGVLYARRGVPFVPMQTGGAHERNRRAGTENVPYIVGVATALRLAYEHAESENARLAALRDRLVDGVLAAIPDAQLTGHPKRRLPGHASFVIPGVEADGLLMHLDMAGVCAASGSACTSGMPEPSHVLMAMGMDYTLALGALRLTLGRSTTQADVDYVVEILPGIVDKLRATNPVYAPRV